MSCHSDDFLQKRRCNNERKTMWKSDWDIKSTFSKTSDNISDTISQISEQYTDEQSCSDVSGVKERMRQLFEKQLYTDVTFYPKHDRSSSISGHRAFLAVGSPLFAKMLFGPNIKDTSSIKMEVQISNLSFSAFSNIVKYLYTDEVFFETDALVLEILEGAEQFEIQSLVERCKSYFDTIELTEENVCTKLQMSISNKIDTLEDRCGKFIQENTFKVLNSTDFVRSSFNTIREICKLQSLNLRSEMALLEAAWNWNDYHSPAGNCPQIKSLLKYIRFLTFTVSELSDIIKNHPDLLTSEEALQIMLYLNKPTPDFSNLPDWCKKSSTSRCFFVENPKNSAMGNAPPLKSQPGKVIFPLKQSAGVQSVTELTSVIQMKCINGYHQIDAVNLSFQGPVNDTCAIKSLMISVVRFPSEFRHRENIKIYNSASVRIPFSKIINVRRGDVLHIKAVARNIHFYKFLQFDEVCKVTPNPHFQCSIQSQPRDDKLFFVSKIEYSPQIPLHLRKSQKGRW